MKRNSKISRKMSVVAKNTTRALAVFMMLVVMAVVNFLANSSCDQLMKSIGEKEKALAKLEDERVRESARWEEMKTPEKLEIALNRHGLAMRYPKPSQIVRMGADGQPCPGQLSVAKARERENMRPIAMNSRSGAKRIRH